MPGFDRTGPMGGGPKTGGARGYCSSVNIGYGRQFSGSTGVGRGMAYGRGFRGGYGMRGGLDSYTENATNELAMLQQQLDLINKRIDDLNK